MLKQVVTSYMEGHWINSSIYAPDKSKAFPITGRGSLGDCETSRLAHCGHNRLTDGSKAVSLTYRPVSTPQKLLWYLFLLEAD
jgi:hypothetical protein